MRKRGARHSTLAVVPLNMKRSQYALDANDEIHSQGYQCQPMQYASMEASAALLLDWFDKQPNARIAKTAMQLAGKIERRA